MNQIVIENEVIFLKAIKELIDSMVNYEILDLAGKDPDSSIKFKSMTHQQYFNIILADFLSCTDKQGFIKPMTFIKALKSIFNNPCFNVNSSIMLLKNTTMEFIKWLDYELETKAWLPSIDTEATINISRISFIKICGNISKHNFMRSVGTAKDIQDILAKSGKRIGLDEAMLVLGEFYEKFHTDIFSYHSSTISEYLNDIRWGIYEYLQPEFHRSIIWENGNPPLYRYDIPSEITTNFGKECYWGIMNEVRMKPFIRRFKVTRFLKMRY